MRIKKKSTKALFARNFIFGVEDSLVSTSGLVAGVAAAGLPRSEIFTTGIVLIFVEAFSMGVGSYLSEGFAEDYISHGKISIQSLVAAIIMLFSYFFSGFIPLSPYILFEVDTAFPVSIIISLFSLFLLGSIGAKFFKISIFKHGLRMLFIGGFAILIGVAVGNLTS